MVQMTGKYQHQKSENLDEYFKAVGMPYIPRKMVAMTNPQMDIEENDGKWTIKNITMLKTSEITFKLGEEFEEYMPGGTLKDLATIEDEKLIITSTHESGTKIKKTYQFDDPEYDMILIMTHEASGQVAKRYFKRIQ